MALSIIDPETEKLARLLAEKTGETVAAATKRALQERLGRMGAEASKAAQRADLEACRRRWSKLPRIDDRSAEEILGYDENGLPT